MPPSKYVVVLVSILIGACNSNPSRAPAVAELVAAVEQQRREKIVIAHRGASGYLPEHTLAAKAMAYAQGADYIEQDLVMTKDARVIVLHDHRLEHVTNVKDVFPDRDRGNGEYFVIDFTLDELRQLSVYERFEENDGDSSRVFEERFPYGKSRFRINTFEEEIELIQGLNASTGRNVGIYPEIKSPAFHRQEGKDISLAVLKILKRYGYSSDESLAYLQCFEWPELKRIHDELMPTLKMDLNLVQLLGSYEDVRWLMSEDGMRDVAAVAAGIGPSIHMIIEQESVAGALRNTGLVAAIHEAGMVVHPYTFRRDPGQIPAYASDFEELLDIFLNQVGVDGVFTDFPDLTVDFIETTR